MTGLDDLSPDRELLVLRAIAALESADGTLRDSEFPALVDPDLREVVRRCLDEAGRVLVRTDNGYTSAYADDIAAVLADEGIGVLNEYERAVLVLVLLHSVAIPRAKGRIIGSGWAQGEPVPREQISRSQVPETIIRDCLQRLEKRRLIRYVGRGKDVAPGSQLARLTPAASERLWEDLLLLAEPNGVMAGVIRRRRKTRAPIAKDYGA